MSQPSLVIALGGNAISKPGLRGTISEQFYATNESMEHVASLIQNGYDHILLTHGNGPQIGAAIMRTELAAPLVYPLPMDVSVADIQGGMGYMIQQVLQNALRKRAIKRNIITLVTQTVVDVHDTAFNNPTKPIGKFYTLEEAHNVMASRGWEMKEDAGRGWRRVVASPRPIDIREKNSIQALFELGHIVIAGGGGGIAVGLNRHGNYYGIEAVIDKDLTSALLANLVQADILIILTGVEYAYIGFGSPKQRPLTQTTVAELEQHLLNHEFADGSMKPKIEAVIQFLKGGGKKAIITSLAHCLPALEGKTGTIVAL